MSDLMATLLTPPVNLIVSHQEGLRMNMWIPKDERCMLEGYYRMIGRIGEEKL